MHVSDDMLIMWKEWLESIILKNKQSELDQILLSTR